MPITIVEGRRKGKRNESTGVTTPGETFPLILFGDELAPIEKSLNALFDSTLARLGKAKDSVTKSEAIAMVAGMMAEGVLPTKGAQCKMIDSIRHPKAAGIPAGPVKTLLSL